MLKSGDNYHQHIYVDLARRRPTYRSLAHRSFIHLIKKKIMQKYMYREKADVFFRETNE